MKTPPSFEFWGTILTRFPTDLLFHLENHEIRGHDFPDFPLFFDRIDGMLKSPIEYYHNTSTHVRHL